jgi:hypothetical protein
MEQKIPGSNPARRLGCWPESFLHKGTCDERDFLFPSTMGNQPQSKIIEDNPIGNGIDAFRGSFSSVCERAHLSCIPDALDQLEHEGTADQFP